MKRLRKIVVRIFWFMRHHKETEKRVREAEHGLRSAKSQAHIVHVAIVQPGRALKDDNNFATIVRDSLRIGHNGN